MLPATVMPPNRSTRLSQVHATLVHEPDSAPPGAADVATDVAARASICRDITHISTTLARRLESYTPPAADGARGQIGLSIVLVSPSGGTGSSNGTPSADSVCRSASARGMRCGSRLLIWRMNWPKRDWTAGSKFFGDLDAKLAAERGRHPERSSPQLKPGKGSHVSHRT